MIPLRRLRKTPLVPITIIALALGLTAVAGIGAQDAAEPFVFDSQASQGFLTSPAARAETAARIAAWNPEDGVGLIAVRYVFPEGYHQIDDGEFFTLEADSVPGVVFGSVLKGEPVVKDGLEEYYDQTTLVMEFRADPAATPERLGITALFQICSEDGTCLFPDSEYHEVEFNPQTGGILADAEVRDVVEWASSAATQPALPPDSTAIAPDRRNPAASLLLYILMALAGGILLNIMPCVLPLLSVKALSLVKQSGQDKRAILRHSWLYVAGIEASFWALAAIVIALQASGRLLGWGFQFQSPAFVLILTAVIWVFALSMFDVFVIEAPRRGVQGASAAGARGGYLGSFLAGIFAVLVATPCTAPFLGAALGFAFSQPPLVILAIFSATGLGLGLPFLLLGIWPGIIKKIPKPGAWMNTFKEVMGFLLIGTAVYLFTTFAKLAPGALGDALWWILFLGFSAWLLGKSRNPAAKRSFRIIGQIAALVIAVGSGFLLVDLDTGDQTAATRVAAVPADPYTISFDESDILARIESQEPVFLEFTASWCTTCKVNQRVFRDEKIRNLMDDRGVTHIKGDLTAYDETMTQWLSRFGRAGVPLYVLFRPGEDPVVFPELITVESLASEIEKLPRS